MLSSGVETFVVPITVGSPDSDHDDERRILQHAAFDFAASVRKALQGKDPQGPAEPSAATLAVPPPVQIILPTAAPAEPSGRAFEPSAELSSKPSSAIAETNHKRATRTPPIPNATTTTAGGAPLPMPVITVRFQRGCDGRGVVGRKTVTLNGKEDVVEKVRDPFQPNVPERLAKVTTEYVDQRTGDAVFTIDGVAYNARGEPVGVGGPPPTQRTIDFDDEELDEPLDLTWRSPPGKSRGGAATAATLTAERQRGPMPTTFKPAGRGVRGKTTMGKASGKTGVPRVSMQQKLSNWDSMGGI